MTKLGRWAARINRKYKDDVANTIVHGRHVRVFMWRQNEDELFDLTFGDAFCHKDDAFDINIGRAIAIADAMELEVPRD